ncbi:MAG: Mur ligase family protein [Acidimicrobiales bacterium]
MRALDWFATACGCAAIGLAAMRWLRVAQREHYLFGSVTVFAARWWRSTRLDLAILLLAVAAVVASAWFGPSGVVAAAIVVAYPAGLGLRGRTSRLKWTRRLTTVACSSTVLAGVVVVVVAVTLGLAAVVVAAASVALGLPALIDCALWVLRPLEDRLAGRYVAEARSALERFDPTIVAVTGSYGKTTTKGYVAHIVAAQIDVLASPASYNNRAGLARTVNEHLRPSVEVLVAEMGTYGPGEIAALCAWMTPTIAVITAVGPAHLERFKTLDRTLAAKAEITERAAVTVLNVDDARLATLADDLKRAGKHVMRVSGADPGVDVAVVGVPDGIELHVDQRRVGVAVTGDGRPSALSNVACAAAVALELGLSAEEILPRLVNLPVAPNRLQQYVAERGYLVLDDTFNSNPLGARLALGRLDGGSAAGRRVLVTPGMVELGRTQAVENAALGEAAAAVCTDVVFVARTNRRALMAGVTRAGCGTHVVTVDRLPEAVEWVKGALGPGDAVLYENDLPDHFP